MRRLILIAPLLLSACASMVGSGSMLVEAVSGGQPLPGATCVLSSGSTTWSFATPATVNIGAVKGDLHVVCDKAGFRTSELILRGGGLSGSSVGVGLSGGSGGRTGMGLGLSLPLMMGYGSYPGRVALEMTPEAVPSVQ